MEEHLIETGKAIRRGKRDREGGGAHENGLPIKFTEGRNALLFPNPWPKKNKPKHTTKLPESNSNEMRAMANFFLSCSCASGDLSKFAHYFGVSVSTVSHALTSYKERQNRVCRPDNTDTGDSLSSFHSLDDSIISDWRFPSSCCSGC